MMICFEHFFELCFNNPKILGVSASWYYLLIPLFIAIYLLHSRKTKKLAILFNLPLADFIWNHNKKSKQPLYMFILSLAILFFIISGLAEPTFPSGEEREGIALMLVVETTESMRYIDLKSGQTIPRIEIAKKEINQILDKLGKNDYVGLVEFEAGILPVACPLPFSQNNKLRDRVNELTWNPPDFGALDNAVYWAVQLLVPLDFENKNVILFSDGIQNNRLSNLQKSINLAKESGIKIYVVDVGNETEILDKHFFKNVIKRDTNILEKLAYETDGKPYKYIDDSSLDELRENFTKTLKTSKGYSNYKDELFFIAFVLLAIQIGVRYGWKHIIQ